MLSTAAARRKWMGLWDEGDDLRTGAVCWGKMGMYEAGRGA